MRSAGEWIEDAPPIAAVHVMGALWRTPDRLLWRRWGTRAVTATRWERYLPDPSELD